LRSLRSLRFKNSARVRRIQAQPEVRAGVGEGDVFHHAADVGEVGGELAALDAGTEEVAEHAAEILVARVAEEAARVGEHADEPAEQAEVRQGIDLPLHRLLLIEEPPAAAELDFPGDGAVLEITDHGREDVVVGGVQVVEHGARKLPRAIERVEVAPQRAGLRKVADAVESRVGPERLEQPGVVVAQGAEVQLLGPTLGGIPAAELEHEVRAELGPLRRRRRPPGARGVEDRLRLGVRARLRQRGLKAVVGEAAAHGVEVIVTFFQRGEQIVEGRDLHPRLAAEPLEPGVVGGGRVDAQGLVGAKGRIDAGLEAKLGDARVVGERVGRIVGRADDGDLVGREDVVHAHRRELRIGLAPDRVSRGRADDDIEPEVPLQLEVRPVVQRVAQRVRDGRAPGVEFLARRRVAGADALRRAVGAHGPPLVVVAAKPDLREVGEAVILRDELLRQVAVVVVDRLRLGVRVIEGPRSVGLQEKVVVDEGFHGAQKHSVFNG